MYSFVLMEIRLLQLGSMIFIQLLFMTLIKF